MDEETKQKLLEELRKEYSVTLKPLKEKQFTVSDILDKYRTKIYEKLQIPKDKSWKYDNAMDNSIRKVVCMHYGFWNTKEIPVTLRQQFRDDLETFIQEYILKEE